MKFLHFFLFWGPVLTCPDPDRIENPDPKNCKQHLLFHASDLFHDLAIGSEVTEAVSALSLPGVVTFRQAIPVTSCFWSSPWPRHSARGQRGWGSLFPMCAAYHIYTTFSQAIPVTSCWWSSPWPRHWARGRRGRGCPSLSGCRGCSAWNPPQSGPGGPLRQTQSGSSAPASW